MRKILTFSLVLLLVATLACQDKNKPTMQARRDSIRVDSVLRLPAVLFNTALAAEKKEAGKAKELYTKLAKDSTFWGEQARLRLELLNVKEIKDHILKRIVGIWEASYSKNVWSIKPYHFEKNERKIKFYDNGIIEWYEKNVLKKKSRYRLHFWNKEELKNYATFEIEDRYKMENPDILCVVSFEGDMTVYLLRIKYTTMSLYPYLIDDASEDFYIRAE